MDKEELNDGRTPSYPTDPDEALKKMLAESTCIKCGLPYQIACNGICVTCDPTCGGTLGGYAGKENKDAL